MVARMKVLVLFILLKFSCVTDGLQCFTCQDAGDVHDCNIVTACKAHQSCLLEVTPSTNGHLYTMECVDNQRCSGPSGGSLLVGRSEDQITKRQTDNCMECCSTDLCNKELCNHSKPSACLDSPKVDCALMSSAFNVCGDIQHAKLFCPQYCGLCTLVDGNWSPWSSWSTCDVTCGNGTESRDRTCTDPGPENGGLDCIGTANEVTPCVNQFCPVHGGWSLWSPWGSCSVTCDIGMQRRDRSCSNPYPALNGDHCFGDSRDDRVCQEHPCANGGWSSWQDWTSCPVTCGGGLRSRQRYCTNPVPSVLGRYCVGEPKLYELCSNTPCYKGSSFKVNSPTAHGCTESRNLIMLTLSSCYLVFSHVLHSSNANYNTQTGVFTCSTPGTYTFSFELLQGSFIGMHCDFQLNSKRYTTIPVTDDSSKSVAIVIFLHTNDRLAIANCSFTYFNVEGKLNGNSFFSGALITQD